MGVRISSDEEDRIWAKVKTPQKIPGPEIYLQKMMNDDDEFPSLKNFQETLNDILTTFETPKSICCFNNNTMQNDNSKQDHPGFVL